MKKNKIVNEYKEEDDEGEKDEEDKVNEEEEKTHDINDPFKLRSPRGRDLEEEEEEEGGRRSGVLQGKSNICLSVWTKG